MLRRQSLFGNVPKKIPLLAGFSRQLCVSNGSLAGRGVATNSHPSLFTRCTNGTGLLTQRNVNSHVMVSKSFHSINSRNASNKPNGRSTKQSSSSGPDTPDIRFIILIALLGFVGFALSVRVIEKKKPSETDKEEQQMNTEVEPFQHKSVAFTPDQAFVVFVLGGPGAGKGTQCSNLVKDYGFVYLSAGDLLREEQDRVGSRHGELISTYIKEGKIVPQEITIELLQQAMHKSIQSGKTTRFLIDGFPRKMDQAITFEEDIAASQLVLFFSCPEEVMLQRLLKRGETSGRSDDQLDSIKKRFQTFKNVSMPVVEYFDSVNKVVMVRCDQSPAKVYSDVKEALHSRGIDE